MFFYLNYAKRIIGSALLVGAVFSPVLNANTGATGVVSSKSGGKEPFANGTESLKENAGVGGNVTDSTSSISEGKDFGIAGVSKNQDNFSSKVKKRKQSSTSKDTGASSDSKRNKVDGSGDSGNSSYLTSGLNSLGEMDPKLVAAICCLPPSILILSGLKDYYIDKKEETKKKESKESSSQNSNNNNKHYSKIDSNAENSVLWFALIFLFIVLVVLCFSIYYCYQEDKRNARFKNAGEKTKDTPDIFLENKDITKGKIKIEVGDIVKLKCECIVNAAKPDLSGGGAVDGAIHNAAGKKQLIAASQQALKGQHPGKEVLATGEVVITDSLALKTKNEKTIKYIIHTAGPNVKGREKKIGDEYSRKNCYINSLDLAKQNNIHSIAFPAISTYNYGFSQDLAAELSYEAVTEWLNKNDNYEITVIFCCYEHGTYYAYKKVIDDDKGKSGFKVSDNFDNNENFNNPQIKYS